MTGTTDATARTKTDSQINGLIKRTQITRASDDVSAFQVAQVSYMDRVSDTEVLWPYGMYGNVPVDSLCLTLSVGGEEGNKVTFPSRAHTRTRRRTRAGEVGIGNQVAKSDVFFDADGNIIIIAPGDLRVTVSGDKEVTVSGDCKLTVTGDVTITGGNVTIDSATTSITGRAALGGVGGLPIARVGDTVSGGVITSGSLNHTAT